MKPVIWEEIDHSTDEEKLQFIKDELNLRSVILFCSTDFLDYLTGHNVSFTKVDLEAQLGGVRKLDERENGIFKLYAGDDANIMARGIDFRGF